NDVLLSRRQPDRAAPSSQMSAPPPGRSAVNVTSPSTPTVPASVPESSSQSPADGTTNVPEKLLSACVPILRVPLHVRLLCVPVGGRQPQESAACPGGFSAVLLDRFVDGRRPAVVQVGRLKA